MRTIQKYIKITMVLGVLSLLSVVFSHLALTDIARGETELSIEWTILQVSALVILVFIVLTLFTLRRFLRLTI